MTRLHARLRREEEGSALVLALAFLSLFGVFVAAILSFADTSFRATLAVRDQGSAHYGADGAIEGAINRLRGDISVGREFTDTTCFTAPSVNSVIATVRCQGQNGSGRVVSGSNSSANKPPRALLSLAPVSSGEDGIVKSSNSTITVHGGVFSNSTIRVSGSNTLTVEGDVTSRGACDSALITSTYPPLHCNYGSGTNTQGDDPNYSPTVSSPPTYRNVPACGSGWLVQFQPGTYDDAIGLSNLTGGGCAGKVFHFTPGAYYFDFRRSGSHVWTVNDINANIVGGTASGWSTSASSRPTIPFPGACDTQAGGVQFIFGGDSQWLANSGKVELCAEPSSSSQQIAVFGLKTGSVSNSTGTPSMNSASSSSYLTPSGALVSGGTAAVATVPAGGSATLTASGTSSIPAGSVITGGTLTVRHGETLSSKDNGSQVTIAPAAGSPVTLSMSRQSSLADDVQTLTAAQLNSITDFSTFTVAYTSNAKSSGVLTSTVDAISLSLTYQAPAFEASSGCVTVRPYTGTSGSCAVLSTGSSNSIGLAIHGTVYAPLSGLDFKMTNAATMIADRGLIGWVIKLALTPAVDLLGAIVQTPDDSTGTRTDRQVVLTAKVAGVDRIRSLVTFADGGGTTPGATVTVNSWSVLR